MKLSISVKPDYRAKPMYVEIEEIEFDETFFTVTVTGYPVAGSGEGLEEAIRDAAIQLRELLEEGFEKP